MFHGVQSKFNLQIQSKSSQQIKLSFESSFLRNDKNVSFSIRFLQKPHCFLDKNKVENFINLKTITVPFATLLHARKLLHLFLESFYRKLVFFQRFYTNFQNLLG